MLQAIRERVTGIVAIFVLGLLAVPFLFFGMESYMRAVPQDAVAVVGDAEISTSEFQTSFARHRGDLRQQQGDQYDEIATNQPEYRREHLESMIDELLLRQYAQDLGLAISDQAIAGIIGGIEAFQVGGQFSPEVYQQALRAGGQTPGSFERELREDLLTRLVPSALAESVVVTETEIDRFISLQNQTRQVTLVQIPIDELRDTVEVSEAEIEAFYNDNQQAFTTEEQVRLAYVELDAGELMEDATLEEEELRRRYEAARQRYLTPEARRASHILIEAGAQRDADQAQQLAMELHQRITEQDESFEELAREYSDDPGSSDQGGDLGWIQPEDMIQDFEDALYALDEAGDVSEPVETRFGWHVIRLDEIRPPEGMSFEEARPEILQEYIERQREDLYIELSERMVDMVYADDSSLEPLAGDLGLDIEYTEPFTRAGGQGIASRSEVVDAAFSDLVLLDGAVSDPIELDRNQMVAIKVEEHFPAEPRPLEEVADQIREQLIEERARQLARERAEGLLDAAGAGDADLTEAAEAEGLELVELDAVSRNDFQHGPDFIQALFRLPAPGDSPTVHVLPKEGSFAVVRLHGVTQGNPAMASDIERRMVGQQIRFTRMNDEIAGLLEWLRDDIRIRVVEERLR